jgi:outer membrane protein assembly factor BamB
VRLGRIEQPVRVAAERRGGRRHDRHARIHHRIQPPVSELTWLAPHFSTTGSATFQPQTGISRGEIGAISIDAADSTYVEYVSVGDTENFVSLVGFAADHSQTFRVELGATSTDVALAGDPAAELAVYCVNWPDTSPITAVDTSDGSVAWTAALDPAITMVQLAAQPDGTVVVAAEIGTPDLADAIGSGSNGAPTIAALDGATGSEKWQTQIAGGYAPLIATGPGGELAVSVFTDGSPVTIDGQTFATTDAPSIVALLEPTGTLRWAMPVACAVSPLVTDGNVIDFAAEDTFYGEVSASGIDWSEQIMGYGGHAATLLAFAGSQLVSTILTSDGATLVDGDVTASGDAVFIADVVP